MQVSVVSAFRFLPESNPPPAGDDDLDRPRDSQSAPAFIGRLRELDTLRSRLVAAHRGSGGVIMISGEPGVGKSRLATEAMQLARKQTFAVIRSRVIEGDWQPEYQCWIEIITHAMEWLPGSLTTRQIPDWVPPLAPLIEPIGQRFPNVPDFAPASSN